MSEKQEKTAIQAPSQAISRVKTKLFRGDGFMTCSVYNRAGDILYVADQKSKVITAIDVKNDKEYKIIGTFHGHNGIILHIELSEDDSMLISCCADLSMCVFNSKNGTLLRKFDNMVSNPKQSCVRGDKVIVNCEAMGRRSKTYLVIYQFDEEECLKEIKKIMWDQPTKIGVCKWLDDNNVIIGCENGNIIIKDVFNDDVPMKIYPVHSAGIKSIEFNINRTNILTGSLDYTAKITNLYRIESKEDESKQDESKQDESEELYSLNTIKTYTSTCPVNYAIYGPRDKKVILAGGVDAMEVASTGNNDFRIKFYKTKETKLVNEISSHFGPVRHLNKCPISDNFVSSGQDGVIKIYVFNESLEDDAESGGYEPFGNVIMMRPDKLILETETNEFEYINSKNGSGSGTCYGTNVSTNSTNTKATESKNSIPGLPSYLKTGKSGGLSGLTSSASLSGSSGSSGSVKASGLEPIGGNIFAPKTNYVQEIMEKRVEGGNIFLQNRAKREGEDYDGSRSLLDENTTVIIKNLPKDTELDDLKDFTDSGRIIGRVKIIPGQHDTIAFIKYYSRKIAEEVIEKMHGTKLQACIIHVEFANQRK